MSSSATTNPNPTPAQEEFQDLLNKSSGSDSPRVHPEDRDEARREADDSEEDEEDRFRNEQIDAAMRMPNMRSPVEGATGVKGVIADARAYEEARQSKWRNRVRAARRSVMGIGDLVRSKDNQSAENSEEDVDEDEEAFLQQWRESRRQELESEAQGKTRANRRTSPSLRMFGRLDTVDALGYLDSIEKVGRETVVVVFVYDHECQVSGLIQQALRPLVTAHPYVHFVKIHYEDIEFDNAAVPAILAYRNQGDLFVNLTGLIEMIPEEEEFDSDALKRVLQKHDVL
ncbi:thioredoxin-like protein [Apiospora kogelbergensis]|uniref:thioredoxin-like protein n=1 Tax=Apiospora kogelbergensis TaxID=1337665 RepID=UPI00312E0CB6